MASLKDCRARAKKAGFTVIKIPKKHRTYAKGYRYRVNHFYAKNLDDLSKAIWYRTKQKKVKAKKE